MYYKLMTFIDVSKYGVAETERENTVKRLILIQAPTSIRTTDLVILTSGFCLTPGLY